MDRKNKPQAFWEAYTDQDAYTLKETGEKPSFVKALLKQTSLQSLFILFEIFKRPYEPE